MGLFPLKVGIRIYEVCNVLALLFLVTLSILRTKETIKIVILLIYALGVYLPACIISLSLECKNHNLFWRQNLQIISWYQVALSFALNSLLIGYVILFLQCRNAEGQVKDFQQCEKEFGSRHLGLSLWLCIGQIFLQIYFALLVGWYLNEYNRTNHGEEKKKQQKLFAENKQTLRQVTGTHFMEAER